MAPSEVAPVSLPPSEVRKTVTIIFSDLKGSTALTERIDAEAINEVKDRYFTAMAGEIERHGGKIEKYIGDAIMAVFGLPRAREDDALRAVRAAHGMTAALARLNEDLLRVYGVEIANRTGVNTGEVVANVNPDADQRLATGDAVNVAARLEQAAPANEVLIGEVTYQLVRAHVDVEAVEPLELKGKSERVPAYRLLEVRRPAAAPAAEIADSGALIGRVDELATLQAATHAVQSLGGARLVTVLGEAGVGKSHLIHAFTASLGASVRVVRGRCLPYGEGITFWPIVEIVRGAAGITDDDGPDVALPRLQALVDGVTQGPEIADRVASVMGLSATRYPIAEVFWGVRKLFETLGGQRPLVVVISDLHNAEPTLLDLLEHVLETTGRLAAVLVVASARTSLLERRADWATAEGCTRIVLEALDAAESARLLEALLDGPVTAPVRDRLVSASEGNPLFLEQLTSMLAGKGLLRRDAAGTWIPAGDLADISVPPTIAALLAARLDDLSREERAVMEPASVIGTAFPEPAVAELVPSGLAPAVPAHLASLDRRQFLEHDPNAAPDDATYRFRNLLIRDATYGSLLKRARAHYHERYAAWAERVNRERNREQEFDEILGWHLEQAYRYRTELGPLDDTGRALALRAGAKLAGAGRRAFARGDLSAAVALMRRAVALLPEGDTFRVELLPELAEALLEAGDVAGAADAVTRALAEASASGDGRLLARARATELLLGVYAPEHAPLPDDPERVADGLIGTLKAAGDLLGVARAWRARAMLSSRAGQYDAVAMAAEQMIEHGHATGEVRLVVRGASGYANQAVYSTKPVAELVERISSFLDLVRGDRKAEANVSLGLAQLEAMQGNTDRARRLYRRGQELLADLGPSISGHSTSLASARVESLAGDWAAAEAELVRDATALAAMDEQYYRSSVVAALARVQLWGGRPEAAAASCALAEQLADADDTDPQVLIRAVRARLAATAGDRVTAITLADEAVALSGETADVILQADTLVDRGLALLALGDRESAGPSLRTALELYERKGDSVSAGRTRGLLAEVGAA